jgi:hypothetical protein
MAFFPERLPTIAPKAASPAEWNGDLLVLGVFEEALKTGGVPSLDCPCTFLLAKGEWPPFGPPALSAFVFWPQQQLA